MRNLKFPALLALLLARGAAGQEELLTFEGTAGAVLKGPVSNPAILSFDATTHTYADHANGTAGTDWTITVTATAAKVTAFNMKILTAPASPFFLTGGYPGNGGTCGATLAAGATCTIVLTYTPPAAGTASNDSGGFTFYYDNGVQPKTIAATATGFSYPNVTFFASFRTPGCYNSVTAETGQTITVTRAGSTGTIPTDTTLTVCSANQVRVGAKGLLYESAGTNVVTRSESLDNAAWTRVGTVSVTADQGPDPKGGNTAELVQSLAAGDALEFQATATASPYWGSLWVRTTSGTHTVTLAVRDVTSGTDLCTKTVTTQDTTYKWFYCRSGTVTSGHTVSLRLYPGGTSGTGDVYAFGGHLEASSWQNNPPTYTPSDSGSTTTRTAETTMNVGAVTLASTWSMGADVAFGVITTTQAIVQPYKDASNWLELYLSTVTPTIDMRIGGTTVPQTVTKSLSAGTANHWYSQHDGTNLKICVDATCNSSVQSNAGLITSWTAFYIANNQGNTHNIRTGAAGGIKNLCVAATATGCT